MQKRYIFKIFKYNFFIFKYKNIYFWLPLVFIAVSLSQFSSVAQSCLTPWIVACQASLSMGVSRQEYWSGLPFPRAGDLPHPGTEPESLAPPALAGRFFPPGPPGKTQEEVMRYFIIIIIKSSTQQQPKYPCAYNFTLVKQKRNLKLSKWKKKCIYLQ